MKIDTEDPEPAIVIASIVLIATAFFLFQLHTLVFSVVEETVVEPSIASKIDSVRQQTGDQLDHIHSQRRTDICQDGFSLSPDCSTQEMISQLEDRRLTNQTTLLRYAQDAQRLAYLSRLKRLADSPLGDRIDAPVSRLIALRMLHSQYPIKEAWSSAYIRDETRSCTGPVPIGDCVDEIRNSFDTYLARGPPPSLTFWKCRDSSLPTQFSLIHTDRRNNTFIDTYTKLGLSTRFGSRMEMLNERCERIQQSDSLLIKQLRQVRFTLQASNLFRQETRNTLLQELDQIGRIP